MLNKSLIAVLTVSAASLLAAGSAFAQEATSDSWMQSTGTMTRADVQAELVAARQSGLTKSWSAGYIEPVRSQLVRAQVKADTLRAMASGEVKAINAEVYSFAPTEPARIAQAGK